MGLFNKEKEFDYFGHFSQVGTIASEMATTLKGILTDYRPDRIKEYMENLHLLENRADIVKHEVCDQLAHEFMPPIEREDITELSQDLDDIADSIEDIIRKMYMFNVTEIEEDAIEFATLLAESCESFSNLLNEFPNYKKSKKLQEYVIDINTIENKGDTLHAESIRRLFTKDVTPTTQMIWSNIYDTFENALDACENTADLIQGIVTKNT